MELKILSWNIWVDCHFEDFKTFITDADADIIGLQEVKYNDPERDVITFMTGLGYKHIFAPEQTWKAPGFRFGPAIFSKSEIESSQVHILSEENKRVAVQADIRVNDEIFHIFNTHIMHTHQQQSDVQDSQVEKLLSLLPEKRTLVMGDFNATPESGVIKRMCEALNNTDPSNTPTWTTDPKGCSKCDVRGVTVRLDYIFASRDLTTHSPAVGKSDASDHLPISVTVKI